ncbi:MAG: nuclear transport factor 2 family protein [Anaerolineae bacterium]|nr:nuclear transport factor 2 family protein [Anaerolineae bacterium]
MPADTVLNTTPDEAAVKAAVIEFHAALNAMFSGDLKPMEAIWSHTSDVLYRGTGGEYRIGWQQVRAEWIKQAAQKLGGWVKPIEIHIVADESLAVVGNYVKGQNFDDEGNPMEVFLRVSSLFCKESGQWKMIGLHTHLLPFSV